MTEFKTTLARIVAESTPARSPYPDYDDVIDAVYPVVFDWLERDGVVFASEVEDALRISWNTRKLVATLILYHKGTKTRIQSISLEEALKFAFGQFAHVNSPNRLYDPSELVLYLSQDKLISYFRERGTKKTMIEVTLPSLI